MLIPLPERFAGRAFAVRGLAALQLGQAPATAHHDAACLTRHAVLQVDGVNGGDGDFLAANEEVCGRPGDGTDIYHQSSLVTSSHWFDSPFFRAGTREEPAEEPVGSQGSETTGAECPSGYSTGGREPVVPDVGAEPLPRPIESTRGVESRSVSVQGNPRWRSG